VPRTINKSAQISVGDREDSQEKIQKDEFERSANLLKIMGNECGAI